jgi:acetylornithine/N-succinyldiaminopimelate aminotransferase
METNTSRRYKQYILTNYSPPPINLERGKGTVVWDDTNKEYLDFTSGVGVNSIGHCNDHWIARMHEQMGKLVHCSNLFGIKTQANLAERLAAKAGPGKLFFCNSGTEANEALIKLARLHGKRLTGEEGKKYKIICAENAFHGRTFGGMSATPKEKVQAGFAPMLNGFKFAKLNDLESFSNLIDEETAAILIETIQGEGGIHVANNDFLKGIRDLCDQNNILLLIDEVQCGIGRTGRFFAYEKANIIPDAIGMAKGLGGGFPIGAIWVFDRHVSLFTPGSHGSTFGGNPLATTAALAVLDVIEESDLLNKVRELSKPWIDGLKNLQSSHPNLITEIRGEGFMMGLGLSVEPAPIIEALRNNGLLTVAATGNTIRLLPPLTVTNDELKKSLEILKLTFSKCDIKP